MTNSEKFKSQPLLLMIAGAKGAVASTIAVAVAAMRKDPEAILPSLITRNSFPYLGPPRAIYAAGWDTQTAELTRCIKNHGVLPENLWEPHRMDIEDTVIAGAPPLDQSLLDQVEHLMKDIRTVLQLIWQSIS